MKHKNEYLIVLRGCDDETMFTMELNDEEYKLLCEVSKKSMEVSTYTCMPDLSVKPIQEADSYELRKIGELHETQK